MYSVTPMFDLIFIFLAQMKLSDVCSWYSSIQDIQINHLSSKRIAEITDHSTNIYVLSNMSSKFTFAAQIR